MKQTLRGHKSSTIADKLLKYLYVNPAAELYTNQMVSKFGFDKRNLARKLKTLEAEGLIKSRELGNIKLYSINNGNRFYREYRTIILKNPRVEEITSKIYKNKSVYIIAGPNGVGKTSFAKKFLPKYAHCPNFINADLIAQGVSPLYPESAALKAGKIVLQEIVDYSRKGADFGFETTLSGKTYMNTITRLREQGYKVCIYYLWVPGSGLSAARIRERVLEGGHDIPRTDLLRRFARSKDNFFRLYSKNCDSWMLFDNSNLIPEEVAKREGNETIIYDKTKFEVITAGENL